MPDSGSFPNYQNDPAGAIPVYITSGGGGGSASAPYVGTPLGYQQITSLATATGLTVPTGATYAQITAEGNSVRWRDDGTNPTANIGMPIQVNGTLTYSGSLSAIKFIQTAATAALDVAYYR